MGLLEPPLQISLVMGVNGGIRPERPKRRLHVRADPGGAEGPNNWQVIGISRDQWKLLGASLVLGGNVRAGLEDNLYLPNGEMASSNGELIAKARQMAEDVGRRAATVAEAREMLGCRSARRLPPEHGADPRGDRDAPPSPGRRRDLRGDSGRSGPGAPADERCGAYLVAPVAAIGPSSRE